jgi:hypothetical protein
MLSKGSKCVTGVYASDYHNSIEAIHLKINNLTSSRNAAGRRNSSLGLSSYKNQ